MRFRLFVLCFWFVIYANKIGKVESGLIVESNILPVMDLEVLKVEIDTFSYEKYELRLFPDSTRTYSQVLQEISDKRTLVLEYAKSNNFNEQSLDSAGYFFQEALVNQVIPYWYSTSWDFNGHTNVPGEGEIACGYLVSTSLKHMGLNISRYKMAQQAALLEIKTLDSDYHKCINCAPDDFLSNFNESHKEGVYMLGLDNHVGLLLKKSDQLFFIHSDYINGKVNIELAHKSKALRMSNSFYVGSVSNNQQLMKKWLQGTRITVLTSS